MDGCFFFSGELTVVGGSGWGRHGLVEVVGSMEFTPILCLRVISMIGLAEDRGHVSASWMVTRWMNLVVKAKI